MNRKEKRVVPPATKKRKAETQIIALSIMRKDAQSMATRAMRYRKIHIRCRVQWMNENREINTEMIARSTLISGICPRVMRNDAQRRPASRIKKKKIQVLLSGTVQLISICGLSHLIHYIKYGLFLQILPGHSQNGLDDSLRKMDLQCTEDRLFAHLYPFRKTPST
jgi:hypothetical protein